MSICSFSVGGKSTDVETAAAIRNSGVGDSICTDALTIVDQLVGPRHIYRLMCTLPSNGAFIMPVCFATCDSLEVAVEALLSVWLSFYLPYPVASCPQPQHQQNRWTKSGGGSWTLGISMCSSLPDFLRAQCLEYMEACLTATNAPNQPGPLGVTSGTFYIKSEPLNQVHMSGNRDPVYYISGRTLHKVDLTNITPPFLDPTFVFSEDAMLQKWFDAMLSLLGKPQLVVATRNMPMMMI